MSVGMAIVWMKELKMELPSSVYLSNELIVIDTQTVDGTSVL
jgi:hypothetical protein